VIEAANDTEVEDRINKLMAQLELESDKEEPDETVMGTLLDRGQKVVTQATSSALIQAFTRLAQWFHEHGIAQGLGLG
jgi:hypothetical protein